MNNAKLGLIIVTMMAAVALFGSFIILAHQNSETKSGNNLVGNVVAAGSSSADIKEQRASSDSLIDSSLNCKWTSWKNRDTPAGTGDWETLADFSNICKNPVAIECKTTDDSTASQTGQIVTCSTDSGLVCKNADNKKGCKDYKVRFCCPITESNTSINKTKPKYDCSDSDNGINFSVKGTTSLSNGETKTDFCIVEQGKSITSKTNILREHYCSGSVIAVKQTVCQYGCNNGTCLASPIPKCIDSDGGKDYTSSGYTTGSNYKTKQYRKAKDRCSSPTELIEMYCDSNMYMKSIVYTCPYGCNTAKGVCFESPGITDDNETNTTQPPVTQPASVEYSYEGYCGDGIVSVDEDCEAERIHPYRGTYITLYENLPRTILINDVRYTMQLRGVNENLLSAALSINDKMFTLEKEKQRHESGLYIYIQNLTSDSTGKSVTLGIKSDLIEKCTDLTNYYFTYANGTLSCTSDCKYNTTACNTVEPLKLIPERTSFPAPLPNIDAASVLLNNSDLMVIIPFRNYYGEEIILGSNMEGAFSTGELNAACSQGLKITAELNGNPISDSQAIQNSEAFTVTWNCKGISHPLYVGDRVNLTLGFYYTPVNSSENLIHMGIVESSKVGY